MTPVTHLSFDALADLDAGLLDDETAGRYRAHVAACPTCRERAAQVSNVTAALHDAAQPVAVPPEVDARISSALREAAAEPASPAPPSTVTPLKPRRRRVWQALSAAAAVIVVAGVAIGAWQGVQDRSPQGSAASGSSSSADSAPAPSAPKNQRSEPGESSGKAQSESGSQAGGSAASRGEGSMVPVAPTVGKQQLPRFARELARGQRAPVAVEPACSLPRGRGTSSLIRWHGHPAVLVLHRAHHTVVVLDCRTAARTLYSTQY